VLDAPPSGTFNYRDTKEYTPAEAIDLLNSVLLTKGHTLVRRDRLLMLVNLEDGVPPNLVPQVTVEMLDKKGEFELVSCLFQLEKMTANEAAEEIGKLLGPQGSIVVLPKARQIFVTETAGKLRTVRSVLDAIERPTSVAGGKLNLFKLKHVDAEDVLGVIRELLGLPEDQNASADGSIRIAVDPLGTRLIVSAKPEQVKRVEEIIEIIDVPRGDDQGGVAITGTPKLEVYTIDGMGRYGETEMLMAGRYVRREG
jgi:type II secretory pathway component GspD/PulD (secretin)